MISSEWIQGSNIYHKILTIEIILTCSRKEILPSESQNTQKCEKKYFFHGSVLFRSSYTKTRKKAKKMRICKKNNLLYNNSRFYPYYMSIISIFLLILSIIIILAVMLQAKWTGLSIVPGSNDFGKFERRGSELVLHRITIWLISVFVLTSVIAYFIA